MSTVLISGASGYLALHIVSQLLKNGYTVIGTVKSSAKATILTGLFSEPRLSFEIVPDVGTPGAFDEVFQNHPDIEFVIHAAAVLPSGIDKDDYYHAFFETSVKSTTNIPESIRDFAPNVKHVVHTSSNAALQNFKYPSDPSAVVSEETWNETSWEDVKDFEPMAYSYSKAEAERSARSFVK
ncbi:unnamed protein product [Kuraishia capsulata CBS 1993]|uniref:NAD-dependent epimerase/dehydratase domain-containing protein n=1 Tax=Kuraishia capsulata CBS 1993 TaxID=1382522 RepID=W6MNZ2_9ASCO|nr:uncharacterized protein KUCA_T00004328001 [Kuraishia capsulata CBS 1993]CDK28346.1 unnamed protein product [Kuraishia capsulata CBS 1993]